MSGAAVFAAVFAAAFAAAFAAVVAAVVDSERRRDFDLLVFFFAGSLLFGERYVGGLRRLFQGVVRWVEMLSDLARC